MPRFRRRPRKVHRTKKVERTATELREAIGALERQAEADALAAAEHDAGITAYQKTVAGLQARLSDLQREAVRDGADGVLRRGLTAVGVLQPSAIVLARDRVASELNELLTHPPLYLSRRSVGNLSALRAELEAKERSDLVKARALFAREERRARAEAAERKKEERTRERLRLAEQRNAARERKERDRHDALRAAAVSATGRTRALGASIKRKLDRQTTCPYCGGPLGVDPHADHIYPVAKGGRSVISNMVMTCASCNGKKRHMTVAAFASAFQLDRAAIEARLQALGKDY